MQFILLFLIIIESFQLTSQIFHFKIKMSSFHHIIKMISEDPQNSFVLFKQLFKDPHIFLFSGGSTPFKKIWLEILEKQGFFECYNKIEEALFIFLQKILSADTSVITRLHEAVIRMVIPEIVTFGIENGDTLDIIRRVKQLKGSWGLDHSICGTFLAYFESKFQEQNIFLKVLLSQFLQVFNMTESQVNYQFWAIEELLQIVSETLYILFQQQYENDELKDILDDFRLACKKKMSYLLFKLKQRPETFALILTNLTLPQQNKSQESQLKNILTLLIIFQNWDRLKFLKEPIVSDIFSEALSRIIYLFYNGNFRLAKIFFRLLILSPILKWTFFLEKIAQHLIALHKIYNEIRWTDLADYIEQIWRRYCYDIKINEIYLTYCPLFVQEKARKAAFFKQQNNSLSWSSYDKQPSSKKQSRSSGKSLTESFGAKLRKWMVEIEDELKIFNLQKVYLLLMGLKKLIQGKQVLFEQSLKEKVLILLTTIAKKISKHDYYRYNCSLLNSAIYHIMSDLNFGCSLNKFSYNDQVMGLELFCLCKPQGDFINLNQILDFHEKFNYREKLHTMIKLKMIKEKEIDGTLSKLENYEKLLGQASFEAKLYFAINKILKQFNHEKPLLIVAELLLLQSENITNNLLFNFIYWNFSRKWLEKQQKSFIKCLSQMMMNQLSLKRDIDRVRLFLKMDSIFQVFQNQKRMPFEKKSQTVAEKYFQFLSSPIHQQAYIYLSQLYEELHYVKESIFFLELYYFIKPHEKTREVQQKAINLYQQIDSGFSQNIAFISRKLNLQVPETVNNMEKQLFLTVKILMLGFDNSLKAREKEKGEVFYQEQPLFIYWYKHLQVSVLKFYKQISEQAQPNHILENFILIDIITVMISFKLQENTKQSSPNCNTIELLKKTSSLNTKTQLTIMKVIEKSFRKIAEDKIFKEGYLNILLETRQNKDLLEYLYSKEGTDYKDEHLIYHIRYNYQEENYVSALSYIKEYQNLKLTDRVSQVNQLDLECRYKSILIFEINDYFKYLHKALTSFELGHDKKTYFEYYFKMFRMLFKRYNFSSKNQNDNFMQVFYNFLSQSKILTLNREYISEAIFYWLRFVIEQFYFSVGGSQKKQNYGLHIIDYFKEHSKKFIPYCTYLLQRISAIREKNDIIITIITFVLSNNPTQCIWIISFLKNFHKTPSKQKSQEKDQLTGLIYDSIYKDLVGKNLVNLEYINFIGNIVEYGLLDASQREGRVEDFKKIAIPENIPFLFSEDMIIKKLSKVISLGNGKSRPLQLSFTVFHPLSKTLPEEKIILIKSVSPKHSTMQSSVANFFTDIDLMDKDTTYRIFHLTKTLVAIQYIKHFCTINKLISVRFPEFREAERTEDARYNKFKTENKIKNDQTLNLFDSVVVKANDLVKMSKLILEDTKSANNWWERNTNFIRTHANWSYLGYVVGLGDRHLDNILITSDWKLIHIDFEYSLNIGLNLPYPEWAPFRLTPCLTEPLGILGIYGLYYSEMIKVAKKFMSNEANSWKAVSNLSGILNNDLTISILARSRLGQEGGTPIEIRIGNLIDCASSKRDLRKMFKGWTPYV